MSAAHNILDLQRITKVFPGVIALDKVDLDIIQGEVHVLVGENGAGKSTLIKVLCGIYIPDSGDMRYAGAPYAPHHPLDAIKQGIRVVYQEFNLLSYLSVAENIFFERLPQKAGWVDYRKLYRDTEELLATVGLDISPKMPVELLGVAQMQLIEIAKALSSKSKVLILDEPTATLTTREIDTLFSIIKSLQQKGVTIIYISHRLQELYEIGSRITVLRNGTKVGTHSIHDVGIPDIVKMMVGRSMDEEYPFKEDIIPQEEVLQVKNLQYKGGAHNVSLSVRKGELLGISGLVGSGRTETMRAIFGADPREHGSIMIHGKEVNIQSPRDAVKHGLCLLTEDRKNQGLILDMSCSVNITLSDLAQVSRGGLLQNNLESDASARLVDELEIKTPSVTQWARNLSGGNQQKVVIAKWLFRNADILIFDEPTRGIDVGAKYEIYLLLWKLAEAGKAIIMVSSDLPELLGVCHRILVFSNGKIAGDVSRSEFDQERILSLSYQEYIRPAAKKRRAQA
ncbi:D-xylose ABC transporter ATP-binding protein [candidate division KSB3 bacterium]|uniref:D-xylose ABC transporter ATP-binding protein n=1 Tax=candidate division KSB3 bacterium TaxID=2044937 RepID=A0A2G6E6B5_9BACT|nr:MAG: D-xylose ABC transporter ATP-binding protein [candidate division KSB3 bacterium]PIE30109.1 MAG: D-xylose ABC transporter ATP-binding protein [candidate division KSB3 bacterium]